MSSTFSIKLAPADIERLVLGENPTEEARVIFATKVMNHYAEHHVKQLANHPAIIELQERRDTAVYDELRRMGFSCTLNGGNQLPAEVTKSIRDGVLPAVDDAVGEALSAKNMEIAEALVQMRKSVSDGIEKIDERSKKACADIEARLAEFEAPAFIGDYIKQVFGDMIKAELAKVLNRPLIDVVKDAQAPQE